MKGLSAVLFASLMISGAAHSQEWRTYTYREAGFAIEFPGIPNVQTTQVRNAAGVTLPVTRYVVRQVGVQYTLSVVDYSSTNADALSTIGETAKSFSAQGRVSANAGARVNGNHGRELTITESDGSRSDIAIFFVNKHLYTAVGQALPPNSVDRSADTARFQESLQFLDDDSGFLGLFGGGARASSNAEHFRTFANQRADAACAGKSAGDIVHLNTPTGPVLATCILTARPNPPSGSTSEVSPGARNSNGPPNHSQR